MPFITAFIAAVFGAGTIAAGIASAAIGIGLNFVVGKLQASRAGMGLRAYPGAGMLRTASSPTGASSRSAWRCSWLV